VIDVQQADRGRSLRLLGFLAASKSCLADDESKNWISTITSQGRSCLGLFLLQGFGSGSSTLHRWHALVQSDEVLSRTPMHARIAHQPPTSGSSFRSKLPFRSWPSSMTSG